MREPYRDPDTNMTADERLDYDLRWEAIAFGCKDEAEIEQYVAAMQTTTLHALRRLELSCHWLWRDVKRAFRRNN